MPHQISQSSVDIATHCAYECEHCADQCYGSSHMAECGRLARDSAEICSAIAGFMSRSSRFIPSLVSSCVEICEACASECEKHNAEHCRKCAEACRRAAEEFRKISEVAAART